jgi:hypothetical protein
MANKMSATEDQIGKIHQLTTDIYTMKLESILQQMKNDKEAVDFTGDIRVIQAAGKWVEYNEVKSQLPEEQEDNPLKKKLAEVKNFKIPVAPTLSKEG